MLIRELLEDNKLLDKPTATVAELAKKYDTTEDAIEKELIKGIKVEKEHTSKDAVAREIALDHLGEDLHYYEKLAKIDEAVDPISGSTLFPYKNLIKSKHQKKVEPVSPGVQVDIRRRRPEDRDELVYKRPTQKKPTGPDKEDNEKLDEARDGLLNWLKNYLPTWPEYVIYDWLYKNIKEELKDPRNKTNPAGFVEKRLRADGLFKDTKWTLIPNFQFSLDVLNDWTVKMIKKRWGGETPGFSVPNDAARHAVQKDLLQKQGISKEPVIMIKRPGGYELVEGWHRTIQHFTANPEGYVGPAWVANGVGVTENFADGKGNASLEKVPASMPVKKHMGENVIKLGTRSEKARAWIEKVYAKFPQTWQNNHVMPMGGTGDDQQFAMFELEPSFSQRDAVEIKWFQAYPMRQGVGSRAMKELQRIAHEDGIALTLYPWDKGQVSQSKLTKFYKGAGFKPTAKGAKNMAWNPVEEGREEALHFATQAHAGQTRAGGAPYISHPVRVAQHVEQWKKSHNIEALISAAYLHDTLEDTDTTHEALHDLFGGLVASLVQELTSNPNEIKKVGKAAYLAHKMAAMSSYALVIKLADRLDNVKDITTAKTPEWRTKYKAETEHILDYIEKNRALSDTHQKLIELIRNKLQELQTVDENFADGKGPGKPGDSARHGIPKGATIAQLEKAAKSPGRKGQLARWQLNMRRGKAKHK